MKLAPMEQAALEHVAEYHRYERSPQAAIDRQIDRARRAAADKKAGHLPACSLTRCADGCGAGR